MKKIILTLFVFCSLILATACPKIVEKNYRTAKELSAQMQIYTINLIDANIAAFKSGEISQPTFQTLTAATGKLTKGIEIYREGLAQVEKIVKAEGQLPPDKLSWLNTLFNENVITPFFDVLESVRLLSAEQSDKIKTIIASLRLAILTIQDAFNIASLEVNDGYQRSS